MGNKNRVLDTSDYDAIVLARRTSYVRWTSSYDNYVWFFILSGSCINSIFFRKPSKTLYNFLFYLFYHYHLNTSNESMFRPDQLITRAKTVCLLEFLVIYIFFLLRLHDYMMMHFPFSAQGLFFLSGACIRGSFFSFSSTYSLIL